ncbi:MAG: STAS domain-containing protein [Actinomycetota bacterium]
MSEVVAIDQSAGRTIVRLFGSLDLYTSPQVRQALTTVLLDSDLDIVIDASELTIIDSAGLGVLVTMTRRVRQAGRDLRLAHCGGPVRDLLSLTTLDQIIAVHDTVDDALAASKTAPDSEVKNA